MAARERYSKVGPYILMQTIGVGSFGKVKLAIHEKTHQRYACKVLDKSLVRERTLSVNKEISIMRCLRHDNTVSLVGVLTTSTKVFIIMELVTGGELFSEIERHKRLTENYARFYFRQLVEGVEHCHEHGIFHRDLKPENLLLDENRTLKISDFGLSAFKVSQHEGDHDSVTGSLTLHTQCGTPNYVAPEIITLDSEGYSGARADVWSCGVILYVLCAGALPFDAVEMDALFKLIVRGDPDFPDYFSYELKDLITRMLQRNPETRLKLSEVRRHPWFNGPVESCMPGGTPPVPAPGHPPLSAPEADLDPTTLPPIARESAGQRQHQQRASALHAGARGAYDMPEQSGSRDPASPSFKSSAPSSCSSSSSSSGSSSSGSSSQSPPNAEDAVRAVPGAPSGAVSPLAIPAYVMTQPHIDQSLLPKDSLDVTIQAQVVGSEIVVLGARPPSDGDDEGSENADDYYDEDARNVSDHHDASTDEYTYVGSTYNTGASTSDENAVSQRISLLGSFVAPELHDAPVSDRSNESCYVDAKSQPSTTVQNLNTPSDESDVPTNDDKLPVIMRVKQMPYEGASDSSVQSSDEDLKYEEAKEIAYTHDFDPDDSDIANQPNSTVRGVRRVRSVEDMEKQQSDQLKSLGHDGETGSPRRPSNRGEVRRHLWDRDANTWRSQAQSYYPAKSNGDVRNAEELQTLANEVQALFSPHHAEHLNEGSGRVQSNPNASGEPGTEAVNARREDGRSSSYTGASAPLPEKARQRKVDRQRKLRAERARKAAQHTLSQRYAATNNSWVKSSGDQMVWCHMMKDYDLIPDQVEFGMPSDALSDLWQKGLAKEGLGPKKSFMEVRYGAIHPAPTRSTMYLSPQRRAGAQAAEALLRRKQRHYARPRLEELHKPFPPSVQEKLERLTIAHGTDGSERARSPNDLANNHVHEKSSRVSRANVESAIRNADGKKKSRGERSNVTFAADLIVETSPVLSTDSATNPLGPAAPPAIDDNATPVLPENALSQDNPQADVREATPELLAPEDESPMETTTSHVTAGDNTGSRDVHSGKDPPLGTEVPVSNGPSRAEAGSTTVSPMNRSFATSASGGSPDGGSNTGDWSSGRSKSTSSSGRSKSTSRGERNSPPPPPPRSSVAPESVRDAGTAESATWAESGTLSATSGPGGVAAASAQGMSRSSPSQAHAGSNLLYSVPSAPRSEASEMMLWSDEHAADMSVSEDVAGRMPTRRMNGVSHMYNIDEERVGSGSGRSGRMRLGGGRSTDGMRGVSSISKVSPFELNIPSPKGSAPPSNHMLNRVPSVTARLFGRHETTVGQSPKSRWQFQTARGVKETFEVVNEVLGTVGMAVQRKKTGRRIRLQCEWRRDGTADCGDESGPVQRERASTAVGVLIVIEAADQGGLSAVQVARSGTGRRADDAEMQVAFERLHEAFCEQLNKMAVATRSSGRASDEVDDDEDSGDGNESAGRMGAGPARRGGSGRFELGRGALRRIARVVHVRA